MPLVLLHVPSPPPCPQSLSTALDLLHVPGPSPGPQYFCTPPVPLRAGSWAATASHQHRPTPGFSPRSRLPGLNFLSTITNVKKNPQTTRKSSYRTWDGGENEFPATSSCVVCWSQLACYGPLIKRIKPNHRCTPPACFGYRLLLLKRKHNTALSFMLFYNNTHHLKRFSSYRGALESIR